VAASRRRWRPSAGEKLAESAYGYETEIEACGIGVSGVKNESGVK
jgi:hypothetical protein